MEEQIKRATKCIRGAYACFWILPVLITAAGEIWPEWTGIYAANVRHVYIAETISILLTALCIPISLRLFSSVLVKKIDNTKITEALRLYVKWNLIRLGLLILPLLCGLMTYYLAMSNKGLLCALIALVASLFCVTGEERLRRELKIDKGDD